MKNAVDIVSELHKKLTAKEKMLKKILAIIKGKRKSYKKREKKAEVVVPTKKRAYRRRAVVST